MSQSSNNGFPPQHQEHQPGRESDMRPPPRDRMEGYLAAGKLENKVALITGGDSGIGRAVSIGFAKEGADVVIVYLEEDEDAHETKRLIEDTGRRCELLHGDVGDEAFCKVVAAEALQLMGKIDILVNNAGEQHVQESIEEITDEQLEKTFRTNVFSMFYITQALVSYMQEGACIINTASITAYEGKKNLIDYSATKGAVVSFTRALSQSLVKQKIRVNAVAPGPIWTPLIPASFDAEDVAQFGTHTPMGRAGQPDEVAPSYIFLASDDASYMTGQVLHPNGGTIVNG